MLKSTDGKILKRSREEQYDSIVQALGDKWDIIRNDLHLRMSEKSFINSSTELGSVWDEPYAEIWRVCFKDMTTAALMWGVILWNEMVNHPDEWFMMKDPERDGKIYFKPAS